MMRSRPQACQQIIMARGWYRDMTVPHWQPQAVGPESLQAGFKFIHGYSNSEPAAWQWGHHDAEPPPLPRRGKVPRRGAPSESAEAQAPDAAGHWHSLSLSARSRRLPGGRPASVTVLAEANPAAARPDPAAGPRAGRGHGRVPSGPLAA
jgi:hypothetical protein